MTDELFLIYINYVGKNYKGEHIYEFLFSNTTKDVDGTDWDLYPAAGNPEPPNSTLIKCVGKLVSGLKLIVVQESDSFAVWDAVDGIIALAWEDISEYETYPETRLAFKFGDNIEVVKDRLYERDITIEFISDKNGKSKK